MDRLTSRGQRSVSRRHQLKAWVELSKREAKSLCQKKKIIQNKTKFKREINYICIKHIKNKRVKKCFRIFERLINYTEPWQSDLWPLWLQKVKKEMLKQEPISSWAAQSQKQSETSIQSPAHSVRRRCLSSRGRRSTKLWGATAASASCPATAPPRQPPRIAEVGGAIHLEPWPILRRQRRQFGDEAFLSAGRQPVSKVHAGTYTYCIRYKNIFKATQNTPPGYCI